MSLLPLVLVPILLSNIRKYFRSFRISVAEQGVDSFFSKLFKSLFAILKGRLRNREQHQSIKQEIHENTRILVALACRQDLALAFRE